MNPAVASWPSAAPVASRRSQTCEGRARRAGVAHDGPWNRSLGRRGFLRKTFLRSAGSYRAAKSRGINDRAFLTRRPDRTERRRSFGVSGVSGQFRKGETPPELSAQKPRQLL